MKSALYSKRVVLKEEIKEATIFIDGDKISAIENGLINRSGYLIENCGNDVIMPGLIDSHVHINEPGRTDWEGFDSATKSAAAGGITTLIDMPLNSSPVTNSVEAFELKLEAARYKIHTNCGFWGGFVPDSLAEVKELLKSGVMGIKVFLCHSGIDDFPNVTEEDLRRALPILKEADLPLLVHCELESDHPHQVFLKESPYSYYAYLKSRPARWEDEAISLIIRLCREYDVRCHIVHLSSEKSLKQIREARKSGLPLTVETCPHYLVFNAEDINDESTEYKCAPPIRGKKNNKALWQAVRDGLIDFIVTDHSPAPPELKEIESGNFDKAWGGIASLQLSLPAVWTRAQKEGLGIKKLSELMCSNVAQFLRIDKERGQIEKGYYADIVVWSPEELFVVKEHDLHHKHKVTPYLDSELKGVVRKTYVSGYKVFDNGDFGEKPRGKIMLK